MKQFIYETSVYCGRMKEWCVLNLNSGTVYSKGYATKEESDKTIEDGVERSGMIVKKIELFDLHKTPLYCM